MIGRSPRQQGAALTTGARSSPPKPPFPRLSLPSSNARGRIGSGPLGHRMSFLRKAPNESQVLHPLQFSTSARGTAWGQASARHTLALGSQCSKNLALRRAAACQTPASGSCVWHCQSCGATAWHLGVQQSLRAVGRESYYNYISAFLVQHLFYFK